MIGITYDKARPPTFINRTTQPNTAVDSIPTESKDTSLYKNGTLIFTIALINNTIYVYMYINFNM